MPSDDATNSEASNGDISDLQLPSPAPFENMSTSDIPEPYLEVQMAPLTAAGDPSAGLPSGDLSSWRAPRDLRGTDDILAYVDKLKSGEKAQPKVQVTLHQDRDGNDFEARHTALSSLSERTEERTIQSSTKTSERSEGTRSLPAHMTLAQSLRIHAQSETSRKALEVSSTTSSRSTSPSKRPISPAIARRMGHLGIDVPASSAHTGVHPLLAPSRSAGDLIRFFDGEVAAATPIAVDPIDSEPPSPTEGRGHISNVSAPLIDLSPTRPLSIHRPKTPASQTGLKRICTSDLLYCRSSTSEWLPCVATLYLEKLIIDYQVDGVNKQLDLSMRQLRKVESVRSSFLLQTEGKPTVHAFDLLWRNEVPTVRLGTVKPAERVQWITRMLDMLEYTSTVAESISLRSYQSGDSLREPTAPAVEPSSTLGNAGAVPGWAQPKSRAAQDNNAARPAISRATTKSDAGLSKAPSGCSLRSTQGDLNARSGTPKSQRKPVNLAEVDRRLISPASSRSQLREEPSQEVLKSPPLPPLPLHVRKRSQASTAESRNSTFSSGNRSSVAFTDEPPRISLQDFGPTLSAAQSTPQQRRRGAWSDAERNSVQSDGLLLGGYRPGRAVARDMQKLLRLMERQDSISLAKSRDFEPHLDDLRRQLCSIADRLRSQAFKDDAPAGPNDEPTIADKVDYMLSLCNILMESHNKMSSQIEHALASKGVVPEQSPTSKRRPSDAASLKAAALNRIEDMLQTVLGRLDGSPEDSPEDKVERKEVPKQSTPRRPVAADDTPRALVPLAAPVGTSIPSSIGTEALVAEARKWKGQAVQMPLPSNPASQPPASETTSSSSSDRRVHVAEQRAFTQQRLEGPTNLSAAANEASRWSATTQDPFINSRPISSNVKETPERPRQPLPRPVSPMSQSTSSTATSRPRDMLFDERTQLIMQGIMNKLEALSERGEATDKHQTDVVGYLSRVDDFLREDISSRNSEWQTIVNTLAGVKAAVDALPSQLAAATAVEGEQPRKLSRVPPPVVEAPQVVQEKPSPPRAGLGGSQTRGSLLRRIRGSDPPQGEANELGQSPRKRSLSMPKANGPRGLNLPPIRLWGGPTPTDRPQRSAAGWTRKNKQPKVETPGVEGDYQFDSLAAAHAAFGDPVEPHMDMPEPTFEMPMPPEPPAPPMGPRAPPFVPSLSTEGPPRAAPPLSAMAKPSDGDGIASVHAGIREVLGHLREQAIRDQQRLQREEEARHRAQEPTPAQKQAELDRKADSIRDSAKESKLDALIASLEKRSTEHDNLLRKMAEANMARPEVEKEKAKLPGADEGAKVLASIKDGFDNQVRDFKQSLAAEVRTMLAEVGALRDQKKTLQAELAELFAFKAKHLNGAPDSQLPAYAPKPDGQRSFPLATGGGVFKPTVGAPDSRRGFGPFGIPGGAPRGPR